MKRQEETLMGWNIIWRLFKLFGFTITIPWLIYHFYDIMKQKRMKAALGNKVVMITGASSGLGEALAHTFYSFGCRIILVSRRKEELERVKNDLMNTHQTVPTYPPIVLPLDLTEINNLKDEVSKAIMVYGRIDILINNAGISYRGEVINTNVDIDIKVMLTNYFSQIALTKNFSISEEYSNLYKNSEEKFLPETKTRVKRPMAIIDSLLFLTVVLPYMIKQQSGHIVAISSVQGRIAIPFRSAYAASKHALQAWCDTARAELSNENIKFTVVNPGYIKTSLSLNALTGSGQVYGIMDKNTESGFQPKYVAERILKSVLKQEKEVTIAPFSPKGAIILRTLFPSLYFWIMQKRARKLARDK